MWTYRRQSSILGAGDREFKSLYPDNGKYQFSLTKSLVLRRGSFFLYLIIYLFLFCSLIVIYIQISPFEGHDLKDIESLVVYLGDYDSRTQRNLYK